MTTILDCPLVNEDCSLLHACEYRLHHIASMNANWTSCPISGVCPVQPSHPAQVLTSLLYSHCLWHATLDLVCPLYPSRRYRSGDCGALLRPRLASNLELGQRYAATRCADGVHGYPVRAPCDDILISTHHCSNRSCAATLGCGTPFGSPPTQLSLTKALSFAGILPFIAGIILNNKGAQTLPYINTTLTGLMACYWVCLPIRKRMGTQAAGKV